MDRLFHQAVWIKSYIFHWEVEMQIGHFDLVVEKKDGNFRFD